MRHLLTLAAIKALRPVEIYHAWTVRRRKAKGKSRRPADIGAGAVTTKQRETA